MSALLSVIDELWSWVDDIPPVQQSLRYGNPAYRTWAARLQEQSEALMRKVLPESLAAAAKELAPYLADSFGNATRIDYGTGHETNFCALLYCLAALGVLQEEDQQAAVCAVFTRLVYLLCLSLISACFWP